ncbi:Protein of unknown function [Gryllus bimaculatus]|nr:Protein of unknown function [Gryllus bimaculatus]
MEVVRVGLVQGFSLKGYRLRSGGLRMCRHETGRAQSSSRKRNQNRSVKIMKWGQLEQQCRKNESFIHVTKSEHLLRNLVFTYLDCFEEEKVVQMHPHTSLPMRNIVDASSAGRDFRKREARLTRVLMKNSSV